jgi:hypothetical protein
MLHSDPACALVGALAEVVQPQEIMPELGANWPRHHHSQRGARQDHGLITA